MSERNRGSAANDTHRSPGNRPGQITGTQGSQVCSETVERKIKEREAALESSPATPEFQEDEEWPHVAPKKDSYQLVRNTCTETIRKLRHEGITAIRASEGWVPRPIDPW